MVSAVRPRGTEGSAEPIGRRPRAERRGRLRYRLLAAALVALAVAAVAVLAASGTATAAHANSTDDRVRIVDAFNDTEFDVSGVEDGNATVAVRATTEEPVRDVQFVYGGTGPLNFSNGGIVAAEYDNGTTFAPGDSFDSGSGNRSIVFFELSEPWDYGQQPLINVSTDGTAYADADPANRSVLTANVYYLQLQDGDGAAITDPTPAIVSNSSSATVSGDLFVTGGEDLLHCGGVVVGGECTAPVPGGTAHTYPLLRSTSEGAVPLPADASVRAFEPSTANGSSRTPLDPGTTNLTVNESTALARFTVRDYRDNAVGVTEIRIENRTTGATVLRWINGSSPDLPLFLSPKTPYDVVIELDSGATVRRPTVLPTKGVTTRQLRVAGSLSPETAAAVGQVVNASGVPLENVTVTAEPIGAGGNPPAFNSTTTDQNGVFAMALPESGSVVPRYQFRLASDRTDNGTLTYFPTRVDAGGDGYAVRDGRTILPPLSIKRGGEVDINVTDESGGAIESVEAFTALSRTTTTTGDRTRDSLTESFSLFSFPGTSVNRTVVRVPSPPTDGGFDVSYNVWGADEGGFTDVCAGPADVEPGNRTRSDCGLEDGGTLNVTLEQYRSVIRRSDSRSRPVGDPSFYNENVLIVRNATTGNVTTYIGPGGVQQYLLNDSRSDVLSVPVPAGNYTAELRPANQFVDRTAVRNATAVSVAENGSGRIALESGLDFAIEPDPGRTDTTLRRTADNTIAVRVGDRGAGRPLDDTDVNVSIRLLYRNGTVATPPAPLGYNATTGGFENATYTPDVGAGEYVVAVRATHEAGNSTYNTTVRERTAVSDFATQIQTRRQTVERNQSFRARLRAFNLTGDPEPIDADADNITLTVYDRDGNAIGRGTADTALTNGRETIDLPGIDATGVYRIGVRVEADDGRQGIDDTWIRISEYELGVSLDKSVYAPNETVRANVTLRTAAGDPVSGATFETTVGSDNGTVSVTNSTSGGSTTVVLDPGSLFGDGTWDGSTFASIQATVETDTGLERVRAGTGIRVRSFQVDASAGSRRYDAGESPVVDVAVPPDANVDSVNVTAINGRSLDTEVSGSLVSEGFYRVTLDSNLTTYGLDPRGTYRVEVEATNADGRTATDGARFTVSSLNLRAEPTARSYDPSEKVTAVAELRYPNGTRATGESVEMELYERGDPPVRVDTNTSVPATDGDGRTSGRLQPQSNGIHVVVVSAGGIERAFPVVVTDITTEFVDESGTAVDTYEFTPGQDDATINITAETGGGGVDGGVIVRALINGQPERLGRSELKNGEAGITFSVPESANPGTYPVEVFVESDAGLDSATARIELTPDSDTISVEADAREPVYEPGGTARLRAAVTEGTDPAAGDDVEFFLVSSDTERSLGNGTTGPDGIATTDATIPTDLTGGEYAIRAEHDSGTAAFDGIFVSDIELSIATNESAYAAGDTVAVNLTATDNGAPISGAEGGVRVRLADGSTVTESFDGSGETSPYEVTVELPDDDAAIGSRTVGAFVRNGSSVATDATSIEVFDPAEDVSLSVPETIVANETDFAVGANATVDTGGNLTVFSPGTASVTYSEALDLNASTSLSLSEPGTYVFRLSVPGVGTDTVVRNVDAGANDPEVRVGPDLTTNATAFATDEEIVIRTGTGNMTAEVFGPEESFTVPLNRESGGTYYGNLSESRPAGPYLVRLDGPDATDVDSVLIEVSD